MSSRPSRPPPWPGTAPRLAPRPGLARKATAGHVIEWESAAIRKERKGWASARALAGLEDDVTPHVLRHTRATWLFQAGVDLWKVAGALGASEDMIRRVDGLTPPTTRATPCARSDPVSGAAQETRPETNAK